MGRTTLGNDKRLNILVSSRDYEALQTAAKKQNTTVSEILRRHIKVLTSAGSQAEQVA